MVEAVAAAAAVAVVTPGPTEQRWRQVLDAATGAAQLGTFGTTSNSEKGKHNA